ncbi:MAG: YfhO family protein [Candidatus Lindowbacteria bacterium]|nr:YfhO family protein [Candidatus Lindowbacteria bacterium]
MTAACILVFVATSAFVFRGVWNPFNTIEGADSSLWLPMFVKQWTRWLLVPRWFPHFLAGIPQQFQFLSHALPLMLLLPPHRFHGFQFMLDTFLAGVFMFAFLRDQRLGRFGALVGGLSFQLGNGLLTAARQGAMWKFDTACWVPLFLLFFSRIIEDRPKRLGNAAFAGATLGLLFLGGEIQIAYYVGLLALAYFTVDSCSIFSKRSQEQSLTAPLRVAGKRLLWSTVAAGIGIVFAAEVISSYASFMKVQKNVGVRSDADNWRFATEFSFHPKETLALALTNKMLGDSLTWGSSGQQVARITDDYMGIVALMFAFVSLFARRKRAYFFAAAALATLVISFGQHFPLPYRLVYTLPLMKGFRNPHKWLFITSLCVPVLAGIGADYWRNASGSQNRKVCMAIFLFLLLMAGVAYVSPRVVDTTPQGIDVASAVRRPLIVLAFASLVSLTGRSRRISQSKLANIIFPLVIVVLLAGDLIVNSTRFISYYDHRSRYINDDLIQWMRGRSKVTGVQVVPELLQRGHDRSEPFRVKLWSESPYLREIVTEALPYHGIDVVDAIMSRRPERYSQIFQALRDGHLPLDKFLQLFNVRYVLSATAIQGADTLLSPLAVFRSSPSLEKRSTCYVYEVNDYLPRAYVVDRFEVAAPEEAIEALARPYFDMRGTIVLEKQPGVVGGTDESGVKWSIQNYSESPQRVSMRVTVDRPALLALGDFFDEHWRASVDSVEAEVFRANYLMRALVVPAGTHIVVFRYRPVVAGYALTLAGWILLIAIVVLHAIRFLLRLFGDTLRQGAYSGT